MESFKGQYANDEQKVKPDIVTVSIKQPGYDFVLKDSRGIEFESNMDDSRTGYTSFI